jgi:MerR family mercuric resistance operon transcriptional regulator
LPPYPIEPPPDLNRGEQMTEPTRSRAKRITRGVLSKRTGCNIETVRYYERIGLMPDPGRSEGGHRLYAEQHVRRLQFIRRCRERNIAIAHVDEVRRKIADLRRLERTMTGMIEACAGGAVPDCPIIDALFGAAAAGPD